MNGFTILLSDIPWNAIKLPSFAIFSHNFQHLSFTGVLNIAVNINGSTTRKRTIANARHGVGDGDGMQG